MPSAIEQQLEYMRQYGGPEIYPVVAAGVVYQPNLKQHLFHQVTLQSNVTIGQPLNAPPPGNVVVLKLVQDTTGSRTVAWAGCYRDAPNWSSGGVASSSANAMFLYDGQSYQYIGGSSAFALATTGIAAPTGNVALLADAPKRTANPQPTVAALTLAGVAPGFQRNTIVSITPTVGAVALAGVASKIPVSIIVPAGGTPGVTPSVTVAGNAPVVHQP